MAASAETARLQAELLQLHLLHRGAVAGVPGVPGDGEGGAVAAWRASARERLRGRFEEAARAEADARSAEAEAVFCRAAEALRRWAAGSCDGGTGGCGGLEGRVAVLDGVVDGVWKVAEPGGRFERVVRGFEKWARRAERVVEGRRKAMSDGDGNSSSSTSSEEEKEEEAKEKVESGELELELELIGEMDAAWKDECGALVRRLDEWRRKLCELGDVPWEEEEEEEEEKEGGQGGRAGQGPSSLARILAGCRALVHGMLAELSLMEQIEREAAAEEMRWVREMNRRDAGREDDEDAPRAGAIWRAL